MALIIVAAKANPALLLPTLLAAAYIKQKDDHSKITIQFMESDSIGPQKAKIELQKRDGRSIFDDAVLYHLQDSLEAPQAGDTDQVDEWIRRATDLTVLDFNSLKQPMTVLDSHLTLRSFIVGGSLTLADLAVWGALRGNKIVASLMKQSSNNISRWAAFIEATYPWVTEVVADFHAISQRRTAAASAAGASYDIGLENIDDAVVTRFPPEPSGYLHIGHAKAALLNDYFAHKQANGTLICRFDDTNPSKESGEFQDSIRHDLNLLGITPDIVSFSSDYFQQLYEYCVKLITEGNAYADDTEKKIMGNMRRTGIASERRNMSVKDSLARFDQMKSGSEEGLRWCIRAKISVDDPNKAMRDPVIYRCNLQSHHRTGTRWKIYPTYDLCAPILDSLEGITHALRTNEYRDRNVQYAWIQDALGLRKVTIWDFSRMNFIRTVLSKRKLTTLVEHGLVWGWDDPRMPTIRGIMRRGMTIPALRDFVLKQGPSKNIINLDWTIFWATNKKYVDPVASRYTAIQKEGMVLANIQGIADVHTAEKPKHAKNRDLGTKTVVYSKTILIEQLDAKTFTTDEEITLMNWGNAFVRKIHTIPATDKISNLDIELHLPGDVKKTKKKITWLSKEGRDLVPVKLVDFGHLITKDKIEKEDDILAYVTPQSEFWTEAWADCNVTGVAENDIIQLERKGYYRVDRPFRDGQPAILFNIPTGKKG